jgi:hypothetical protein
VAQCTNVGFGIHGFATPLIAVEYAFRDFTLLGIRIKSFRRDKMSDLHCVRRYKGNALDPAVKTA